MTGAGEPIRKVTGEPIVGRYALPGLEDGWSIRVPTLGTRRWSPAVATGFLGLIIISAMAGVVAILTAIR